MEAKCSFCDLFGEKPHCHNCKIFKKTKTHVPQEIDCSLEELVEYINTHEDVTERFGVGDYKTIELYTGEKVKMILLDTDKDDLAEGEGNAKTTFGILTYDGLFRMNKENTNRTSWKDCEMRTRMERIFRLLPEIIRNNIKPVVKRTSAGGGSREIIMTTDKCFLFSEVEIRGEVQYSRPGEGEQYEYFVSDEGRNFDDYKWLRSPYYNYSYFFCYVVSSGRSFYNYAYSSFGVAFGFCL